MIITHAHPDGDALGSALALYAGLKSIKRKVSVACIDGVPEKFQYLTHHKDVVKDFDENELEGVIFVDCGHEKMSKFAESKKKLLSGDMFSMNIDHHASNKGFAQVNMVLTEAAAAAEIVMDLLIALEIKITPAIATALLTGLYTDTGGFMHQNTTPSVYTHAAELVRKGGNIQTIAQNLFNTYDLKTLRLWGKVLSGLHITADGAAIVGIARRDYESIGATREDLEGVIDYINSIPEVQYSVMLSEDNKGNVKASLRTRKPDIDVKALAEKFGGGGHIKASGFMIPGGHLEKQIKWKIVQSEKKEK